jgi:hypothetical protein
MIPIGDPFQTRPGRQGGAHGLSHQQIPLPGRILPAPVVTALPTGPSMPARMGFTSPMEHRRFLVTSFGVALCVSSGTSYTERYYHVGPTAAGEELGERWAGCDAGSPNAMLGGSGVCRFIVPRWQD